jgi:sigma-E factor negative regulatory protein RseA
MVMPEDISRLMDGDLEDGDVAGVCGRLRRADLVPTWVCYHVIGETLRGGDGAVPRLSRAFAARLASEPTILAPSAVRSRPVPFVWAAAATVAAVTVVGWVAYATLDVSPTAVARAREAASIRAAQVRPQPVPADYLLAHREYSPTAPMEGIGPMLRAAAVETTDVRP